MSGLLRICAYILFSLLTQNAVAQENHLDCQSSQAIHGFVLNTIGDVKVGNNPKMNVLLLGGMGFVRGQYGSDSIDYEDAGSDKNTCRVKIKYKNNPNKISITFSDLKAGSNIPAQLDYSSSMGAPESANNEKYKNLRCTVSEQFIQRYCPRASSPATNATTPGTTVK